HLERRDGKLRYQNDVRFVDLKEGPFHPPRRAPRPHLGGCYVGRVVERIRGQRGVRLSFDCGPGATLPLTPAIDAEPLQLAAQPPGTDVLLTFAQGDPDRPILLGAMAIDAR
ncbi:MAG: hypothetical protein AAGA56_31260, partial [Myxococcota bacterium]